jgi:uncharacterized protein (TIGR02594 family)
MTGEPQWLDEARKDIGLREVPGAETAPMIARWLVELGAWWQDDETPWCGVAVAAWMRRCGIDQPKHWYRAKGWLDWGIEVSWPVVGAVVVFSRDGGGHVGIVAGRDELNRLWVIGGNQGNEVKLSLFDQKRVVGYRLPNTPAGVIAASNLGPLPVYANAGDTAVSRNEA